MNPLKEIFDRQLQLAKNFIPAEELHLGLRSEEERQRYLASYIQLLEEEAIEFLRECPSRKFWRPSVKNKPVDYSKLYDELADMWHILVAISIISGVNSDKMFELFVEKNNINLERVKNNS